MAELRERRKEGVPKLGENIPVIAGKVIDHPGGPPKVSAIGQIWRIFAFVVFFTGSLVAIHAVQLIGWPLYFFSKSYYYAYMAFTKQQFGIVSNSITEWFAPPLMRISGDSSVEGQMKLDENGDLVLSFANRAILFANHQIYTEWLYLWWISYTCGMHGHLFIILKQSLQYIPMIGPGMKFFGFIFMARNWAQDKSRLSHRLQKLNARYHTPFSTGPRGLPPVWLLIFPEGTNLCPNGRKASLKWAQKQNIPDMKHTLLPRSRGLQFCLQELKDTVEWVYDCTITYEGVPPGAYGQDYLTLKSTYFQGRAPKSVNMYWRRFAVKSIPIDDSDRFDAWLRDRWAEKDNFIEQYHQTGRLPRDESGGAGPSGYMETSIRSKNKLEVLIIFAGVIPMIPILYIFCRFRDLVHI